MSDRAILHVDMDCFYAAVEVLDNPLLRGKPVIVGGTPEGRGVVSAASYEARHFGVHSAMPAARARKLCPSGVFLRPRMERYAEMSGRIFDIFRSTTPQVEGLSLDEAFLDVTHCRSLFGPEEEIGRMVKKRVRDETGLTASVGVAYNKFLAKLASDLQKPNGFVVVRPGEAEGLLAPLPVGKIWGVGEVTEALLVQAGIRTIADLRGTAKDRLGALLGNSAESILELAWGRDERPVVPDVDPKSIGSEMTFAHDLGEAAELIRHLDEMSGEVASRLRGEGLRARVVRIKARFSDFSTVTRSLSLDEPTNSTLDMREVARRLLEKHLDRAGRPLRLLGVTAAGLEGEGTRQGDLFSGGSTAKKEKLDRLVDALREKHGSRAIGQGAPPPRPRGRE